MSNRAVPQPGPLFMTITGVDAVCQIVYWDVLMNSPHGVVLNRGSDAATRDLGAFADGRPVQYHHDHASARLLLNARRDQRAIAAQLAEEAKARAVPVPAEG